MKFSTLVSLALANLASINAFTCSVKKNNIEVFSYNIEEFTINDGICDCCDCSDEPNMTNGIIYCDDLLHEYETILEGGLIRDNIDLGKKTLLKTLILNENPIIKQYESLKQDLNNMDEIGDFKVYKTLTNEIIAFFEESLDHKRSHAEVYKKDQKENIENMKKFFQKEIPMIMENDKEAFKKMHSDIKTLKGLKEKLMVVKFMLSTLESNSGLSFKYSQELIQLDDIVERYGEEFFRDNNGFNLVNYVKDSIYGVNSRVSTNQIHARKQTEKIMKELEYDLEEVYNSYNGQNVTTEIHSFFMEENSKFTAPMKSVFGKYEYILTPEKRLIQQSLGGNSEQYLIGELQDIEFKNEIVDSHYDDIYEMLWKYVQTQYSAKYLHKSIPSKESKITNELISKNNIMKMAFDNGDECWNGPQRSAIVRFQCSPDEFSVVEVVEVDKCKYEIDVNSIYGCL